ncbi:MAG: hypothetical protein QF921_10420 [Pseudomonadales bacterium]|jgi:hypothetical protein|nr:hypothetical protein [Pseudomonadales bacterium]MDP6469747.1 hypothetical protein [Pseudomonadales bacterium]MDP6827651.1 hypothetical protein [Pseudomonadales bacterium]MDP6971908.1 hypothetical protein [Pseudomonadales bacterium]|tara:strand:- start:346 stop:1611 length:1266 start_codon:yes stop_codon:yes gene_type:complete
MKQYWRFYWPLALTALAMGLSVQFQNATLARYPEATRQLAVLALAYGAYGLFHASLQFVAQLSNVYARSLSATSRSYRFVTFASALLMLPVLAVAWFDAGGTIVEIVYGIDAVLSAQVREYLAYLAPLIAINAQRFYFTGLLVQARLTIRVTTLNFFYLAIVIMGLLSGFVLGLRPVVVVIGSEIVAALVHLALLVLVHQRDYKPPAQPEHEAVTYRELTRFFVGVSTTGVMFAVSRPVLFAFVARMPNALVGIAAMRVAFDFTMLFQQSANQFRHFFVTFGWRELEKKRIFMGVICAGLTVAMLLFALTPLSILVWRDLMAIPEDVRTAAVEVFLVMCLMPVVIIYRNYFHGQLMVERRTTGMAVGGMLRVAGIYTAAATTFALGALDYRVAAWILIGGFFIEAATAQVAAGWCRRSSSD